MHTFRDNVRGAIPIFFLVLIPLATSCVTSPTQKKDEPPSATGTWICRVPDSPDTLFTMYLVQRSANTQWGIVRHFEGEGKWHGIQSAGLVKACTITGSNGPYSENFSICLVGTYGGCTESKYCAFVWEGDNTIRFNFRYSYGIVPSKGLEPDRPFLLLRETK